jgi:hypothetical protein
MWQRALFESRGKDTSPLKTLETLKHGNIEQLGML